jgi:hypothetical protein
MKTGYKVAAGLGLAGVIFYFFVGSSNPNGVGTGTTTQAVGKAQDLLAFFKRNGGLDLGGGNATQNQLVSTFQKAWNLAQPQAGYRLPQIRTDGVWDGDTGAVFKQLTGYTPPPKQLRASPG